MPYGKLPTLQWPISLLCHVQRYFRRNEGTTDYATIPEVTLAGDFVIEFDVLVEGTGVFYVFGNSGNFNSRLSISDNGSYNLRTSTNNTALIGAAGSIPLGVFCTISIKSDGSTLSLFVNGALNNSNASAGQGLIVDQLFRNDTSVNGAGILANLKIWDAGTLVRDYPINDGKNILTNAATALGNEIDGLTYALTTAIGGVASVLLTSLSVIGKTYLVEVSYSGVVGDASVRIGGFSGPSFTGTGTIEFVATATTTVNDILGALTGVTSGSVTVSIKEAEGYGTIVNGNTDDWGLFDKQANGDWTGKELSLITQTGVLGDDSDPEFSSVVYQPKLGTTYRIGAYFTSYVGTADCGWSSVTGVPQNSPYRKALASYGDFIGGDFICNQTGSTVLFGRGNSNASFNGITMKEVLQHA